MTHGRTTLIVALLAAALVAGCGDARTPEAFCSTMETHQDRYLEATNAALGEVQRGDGAGLLAGSAQMVSALGDLQVMWKDLAEVAPDDVRSDVEIIRDATAQQLEAAQAGGDALSMLSSGLLSGLTNAGSYQRVDAYVREHCDG